MTADPNYLQRATDLDGMAVNVAMTLVQSLTLIHGGALVAIPAFAEQFQALRHSPLFPWIFGSFGLGLFFAVASGLIAFLALAKRSDEALALAKTKGFTSPDTDRHLKHYRRFRYFAIALVFSSMVCLLGAGYTSYCSIVPSVPDTALLGRLERQITIGRLRQLAGKTAARSSAKSPPLWILLKRE